MAEFSSKVVLGRTGLIVSRLGVGSAYSVSERACRKAFDAGVNYFFWGSVRTPGMAQAIRSITRSKREQLVVVLQCYARSPTCMQWSIERGLRTLHIDQADILLLGWYNDPPSKKILTAVEKLKGKGLFRFVAISSHNRPLFQRFVKDGMYDVFHIRYNAAHRGAEHDIFPYLPANDPSGIVSFTNTRWGDLLKAKNMPAGFSPPQAPECYRFALTNPHVKVAICGPKNDAEMDAALTVLASGPLDNQELDRMRTIGDHVHEIPSLMSSLT